MTNMYRPNTGKNGEKDRPIECLGFTFANHDERRAYFKELLLKKLEDPSFRGQPGFPKGTNEAILAMSDPPYYTACPNPWMDDFARLFGRPYDPNERYSLQPMAVDVTVGKTDAVYRAHSYHTKVPHLAIVPSILHYTRPGDLVLDGFAGSGLGGVAAQWCGVASAAYRYELEAEWKKVGRPAPQWGSRKALLNDLSPAATFMAANYNIPFDLDRFISSGKRLIEEVENQTGWMYETKHSDGKSVGKIEYTVWSEVFSCPECAATIVFYDEAFEERTATVKDEFDCPDCGALLNKDRLERVFEVKVDAQSGEPWKRVKYEPAVISYRVGQIRYEKRPDEADLEVLRRIEALELPSSIPTARFPIEEMYHGSRIAPKGFTNVHHFLLPRSAQSMGFLWEAVGKEQDLRVRSFLYFMIEQGIRSMSLLNRYKPLQHGRPGGSQVGLDMPGVYYVSSLSSEVSPLYQFSGKLERLAKAFAASWARTDAVCISTGTAASIPISDSVVDYIFTDPPFGENIFYADLNFIVEAWHGVTTDAGPEAIIDKFKDKSLVEYEGLMTACFAEYYRVLKPGRWMTVVFSNSRASVWNAIQVALQQAGFVVAEVTALDKTQGSYRQVTSANAVKQDLVVSCYKPNGGLEDRFEARGLTEDTAWDFIRTHLRNLAVIKRNRIGGMEIVAERDARRLFDRMIAWFVRHNTPVPLSSAEFQAGLAEQFPERDGMFFLPNQIDEYDRARMQCGEPPQRDLFVDDERTAIDWLADFLKARPSTYQEVHPDFTQKTGAGWRKHELKPELLRLLDENFLRFDGDGPVPSQIHRYLSSNWKELRNLEKDDPQLVDKARNRWFVPDPNKQQDVEARRDKALLREFDTYKAHKGKKMKEIRLEVMRVGFKAAWAAKDYRTIIDVSAKVPDEVWQEDERLMMLHSMAETRLEAER